LTGRPKAARPLPVAAKLLAWFDRNARDLPWRRGPTPYRTLVSEFMLQQTVVATVIPYFDAFTTRWPDLTALAAAGEDDVLAAWSGLGYYSRARNLHRVARTVVERHDGRLPGDEETLRALPGIGPYTAAAIAAIAFEQPTFALDGNAARVVARLHGIREPIDQPATRLRLRALGQQLVPQRRAGAFMEAVMELGATVCTPRAPLCADCPLAEGCEARRLGIAAEIPVKSPPRPRRAVRIVCARLRKDGRVLLIRRREGLLAGTWALPAVERPTSKGAAEGGGEALAMQALRELGVGLSAVGVSFVGDVRHVFTHRDLVAEVYDVPPGRGTSAPTTGPDVRWVADDELDSLAVSSLLRKLLAAGHPSSPGNETSAANRRRNAP
jgi:A/G-specific adenine glycosylase